MFPGGAAIVVAGAALGAVSAFLDFAISTSLWSLYPAGSLSLYRALQLLVPFLVAGGLGIVAMASSAARPWAVAATGGAGIIAGLLAGSHGFAGPSLDGLEVGAWAGMIAALILVAGGVVSVVQGARHADGLGR
jgi:hypothetical protein